LNTKPGPTIKEFAKRIEAATHDLESSEPRNYEAEARWYAAYFIAEGMVSDHTTKDWAYFVLDGMQPLTDEDVRAFFDPEETNMCQWPTYWEIRQWFGLK